MQLKICGLKYKENIEQVALLKPDYIGFIFYPQSKRFVGDDFVMPFIATEIKKIGIFVNAKLVDIVDKINRHKLDCVQLHGGESPEFCEQIKTKVHVIKAFGIDNSFGFKALESYKNCCDYFLFDTKSTQHGGTGKQFDWAILNKYDNDIPLFLSGGIGLEDIDKIKKMDLNIYAIDVNSKFESKPGLKDIIKLNRLKTLLEIQ